MEFSDTHNVVFSLYANTNHWDTVHIYDSLSLPYTCQHQKGLFNARS